MQPPWVHRSGSLIYAYAPAQKKVPADACGTAILERIDRQEAGV
ncbi:hypothetical protein [Paenibacillus glufosinatiresistens]|nr:hypothetical protein [Paenibacillus sp. YX.27]